MENDPYKLLLELEDEFKELGMPFKVKPIEKLMVNFVDTYPMANSFGGSNFIWLMELTTSCSEEDYKLLGNLFKVEFVDERPMIDFEEYHRINNMFDNEQDAFDFQKTLEFEKERTFHLTTKIELSEGFVTQFIEMFKAQTEPIRQRRFGEQFDEQVEEHLSDEYNKEDGHK